jgi:predicted TPR repeat methyltransferase
MDSIKRKQHWEVVFQTKDTSKVSWYQPVPETSLKLIESLNLPKNSKIIDSGCGDSFLPDYLIEKGFTDITLVDISEKALDVVYNRLRKTEKVKCTAADITCFIPENKFDLWHDRAVFHFLNEKEDIEKYLQTAANSVHSEGYLIIGTFSNNGPDQCSGLNVHQYNENELSKTFETNFNKIYCFAENHSTPSGGNQNFLFCLFQRK